MAQVDDIVAIPLHADAQALLQAEVLDYASVVLLESKIGAHRQNDVLVMPRHVEEAIDLVQREKQRRSLREIGIAIGGTLFGASISGVLAELSADAAPREVWVIVYVAMGFVGLFALTWGIVAQR